MTQQRVASLVLAFAIVIATASSLSAQSASTNVLVARDANLRAGPSISYTIVGSAKAGDTLVVVGCNEQCSWYRTVAGAWIAGFLLVTPPSDLPVIASSPAETPQTPADVAPTASVKLYATAKTIANLRSGPGPGFEKAGTVSSGEQLNVIAKSSHGDWLKLDTGKWIAAFLVTGVPSNLPEVVDIATSEAPSEISPTSTPVAPSKSNDSGALIVQFINPHYDCVQGEQASREGPIWGYRRFQADMFITNNSNDPIEPPWEPTRWTMTDGQTDFISDWNWQWLQPGSYTFYEQPTIQPGSVNGWTFVAFPVDRNQWVKAVDFVYGGHTYHQEFDLGPLRNADNYKDCGEPRSHQFRPTATPDPENLP